MKSIALVLLLSIAAFADGYRDFAKSMGYETNYEVAQKKAKAEGKGMMVLMVSNYCPWCIKFEKRTLSDAAVDKALKQRYIPLILNKEEKNFPQYLNSPVVPATYFIDATNEKIIHQSIGFSNKIEFANLLKALD